MDTCPGTLPGTIVDPATGCSLDQLCPCDGPQGTDLEWNNHGQFVSCVTKASNTFRTLGLMTNAQKNAYVSAAGQSACGADPCKGNPLKNKASSPNSPALSLKVLSFAAAGLQAPNHARVFAGLTEVLANNQGQFVIPLRDAAGKVIKDDLAANKLQSSALPRGSYVVLRAGDGTVTQGLFGFMKKSSVSMSLTSGFVGASYGGVHNLSFEKQGDGVALLGKAGQDEFWKEVGQVRIQSTVTTAADLVKISVCQ